MTASKNLIQAAGSAGGADFYDYTIDNSLRIASYGQYFSRSLSTTSNRKTWTLSLWAKDVATLTSGIQGGNGAFFNAGGGTGYNGTACVNAYDEISFSTNDGTSSPWEYVGFNDKFRDPSSWYHIVFQLDTTHATNTERQKVWVNGRRLSDMKYTNYIAQNRDSFVNSTSYTHYIGSSSQPGLAQKSCDAYIADMIFIDGQALEPTDFAETKNGVWIPKDPSAQSYTYGTNGFWLNFADSSDLGKDVSGQGNHWTASAGINSDDQMLDTPTNNFATLNPLASSARTTLSDGNLVSYGNNSSEDSLDYSTIAVTSGKWYWEEKINAISSAAVYPCVGVARIIKQPSNGLSTGNASGGGVGYFRNGNVQKEGSSVATYATFTTNDVIGVALDVDNLQISFYKNGTLQGTVTGLTSSIYYMSNTNYYNSQTTTNFGQLGFTYTPPTSHLALSTANLPEPAIGPNSATQTDEHFNTVLWTGDQSARTITGYGFQPDFLWTKARSTAESHRLHDAVRGGNGTVLYELKSDSSTTDQGTDTQVSGFTTDGFTMTAGGNSPNVTGRTYVGWGWKGNGSGVSNTDGDVTSTVSANTDAGISICTFTTPSTGQGFTVGHGLGVAPDFLILRGLQTYRAWWVWHKDFSPTYYYLYLHAAYGFSGLTQGSNVWNNAVPTSTVFSTRSDYQFGTNIPVVAYAFAEKEGFSSIGSYTGNGSADGPFIYTGFRPAFILWKSSSAAYGWIILDTARDTYNVADSQLYPHSSGAESSDATYNCDILSNGFKIRNSNAVQNQLSATYIYMAFAENPFKYANAR